MTKDEIKGKLLGAANQPNYFAWKSFFTSKIIGYTLLA